MEMMDHDSVVHLLARLENLTLGGRLPWKADDNFSFTAELPRFDLHIRSRDEDDLHPFVLFVGSRQEGSTIEEISSRIGDEDMPVDHPDRIINGGLRAVYQAAKRSALGIDRARTELFEDLDTLEEPF